MSFSRHALDTVSCGVTSPADHHAGVGGAQQRVVQEALQHRRVQVKLCGQVLRGDCGTTDEPGQTLTHRQRFEKLPEKNRHHRLVRGIHTFTRFNMWLKYSASSTGRLLKR